MGDLSRIRCAVVFCPIDLRRFCFGRNGSPQGGRGPLRSPAVPAVPAPTRPAPARQRCRRPRAPAAPRADPRLPGEAAARPRPPAAMQPARRRRQRAPAGPGARRAARSAGIAAAPGAARGRRAGGTARPPARESNALAERLRRMPHVQHAGHCAASSVSAAPQRPPAPSGGARGRCRRPHPHPRCAIPSTSLPRQAPEPAPLRQRRVASELYTHQEQRRRAPQAPAALRARRCPGRVPPKHLAKNGHSWPDSRPFGGVAAVGAPGPASGSCHHAPWLPEGGRRLREGEGEQSKRTETVGRLKSG